MSRPQLILDAAGVLVTNLSPSYWNAIHSLTGIPYDQLKDLFKNELRDDFWSGKVPEAYFWEWLREKAPYIDSAAAQHMLGEYLKPIPAMSRIAGWSQFADIHILSNHRSEWLAPLLEPVRPYVKSMTISSSAGLCKPDPKIFEIVHTSLEKRQPIFYVDDQEKNMTPAVQLGWLTVIADPEGRWIDQITKLIGELE